jgi:hypothetical protein
MPTARLEVNCLNVKLYSNEQNPFKTWAELESAVVGWKVLHPESKPESAESVGMALKPIV